VLFSLLNKKGRGWKFRPRSKWVRFVDGGASEHDLARKLDHPRRRIKPEEVAIWAGRGCCHAGDLAERWIAESRIRLAEIRVIENVERLHA